MNGEYEGLYDEFFIFMGVVKSDIPTIKNMLVLFKSAIMHPMKLFK